MGVWQGGANGHGLPKVSLEYPSTAISGVARPQGGWPAAVFYPFGHPTPDVYV
jgi:hypothetical protein